MNNNSNSANFKSMTYSFMGKSLKNDYLRIAIDYYFSSLSYVQKEEIYNGCNQVIFNSLKSNPDYTLEDVYGAFEGYILNNESLRNLSDTRTIDVSPSFGELSDSDLSLLSPSVPECVIKLLNMPAEDIPGLKSPWSYEYIDANGDILKMSVEEYFSLSDIRIKAILHDDAFDSGAFDEVVTRDDFDQYDMYEAFERFILSNDAYSCLSELMNREIISIELEKLYGEKWDARILPSAIRFVKKEKHINEKDPLIIRVSELRTLLKKFKDINP